VSVVVQHVVYPALSWNRDEVTYLWQVRGLRAGDLLTTAGPTPHFFQPWLTGLRGDQFFSQYTLGWPGVMLVADVLFGSPLMAQVFGTVVAVLGVYVFTREITRDFTLSFVTAVLMLASPMVITQSGVYLGYLFSLGLGLLFGASLLSGLRLRRGWRLVAAGVLLGVLFITRPFDAVVWAAVMGGYAIFTTWREWSRQLRALGLVFLGILPFFVLTLLHNHAVTGKFTQFPFTAKEPLDSFGFGYRRLMPRIEGMDYTLVEAVKGTGLSGFYVPQFLFGSYLAVLLAGFGLWFRRRDRTTLLLLGMAVAFPIGYFVFWGNRLASGFA
jgi:4-amino-4-deoxy-L-arabinose transferase-like glycosyltransferase